MTRICGTCQTPDTFNDGGPPSSETRPYGPGGSLLCAGCMRGDPALAAEASRNFLTMLGLAQARSPDGIASIGVGGEDGPQPFKAPDGKAD